MIRTDTEHEARQLAAKYFADQDVQILETTWKGKTSMILEAGAEKGIIRPRETLVFEGPGKDAGPIDKPLAWTLEPTWKRGLWLRRTDVGIQLMEWDGLGKTPAEEFPAPEDSLCQWLGPLPPMIS